MNKLGLYGCLVLLASVSLFGCLQTGSGRVTDTIANTETQGLIWKTNDVYLTNDHDADYCAKNENIYLQALNYSSTKEKVTVNYDTYFFFFPWDCGKASGYSIGGLITNITKTE